MSIKKNTVLLLKSEKSDDCDEYKTLLEANNFEVRTAKTLTFQYKNLDILKEKVLQPHNYSGIILSSPRCVSAVHQTLPKEEFSRLWGTKLNFTVGEKTYTEAFTSLGIECKGKESGNAKNLSLFIIKYKSDLEKPLLFPHGNLKTDTLKLELGKEDLQIEGVEVYDTLENPDLAAELRAVPWTPEYVVFFSPSGFRCGVAHLPNLSSSKIVAIGPVTQLAIQESNFEVHAVAAAPTPADVIKAIL